jgi:3-isopropylmalate/(R)-2-methylmalate dehydratase small subunit
MDYGFRAILAPSFADIFFNNCFKNGLLPIALPDATIRAIMDRAQEGARAGKPYRLTVDLEAQRIHDDAGFSADFAVDSFRRHCLLNGLDDVGLTLQDVGAIDAYESSRPGWKPSLAVAE